MTNCSLNMKFYEKIIQIVVQMRILLVCLIANINCNKLCK